MNTTDASSCSCNRGKAERGPTSGDRPQLPKAHSKRLKILFLALASMILFLGALPAQASAQTIVTDKADYAPGEIVTVTGTGWPAGETVLLVFHSEPNTYGDITYFASADENGNFTNSSFAPDISDLGATITLTATGQTSSLTAQMTFTDDAPDSPDDTCGPNKRPELSCTPPDAPPCVWGCWNEQSENCVRGQLVYAPDYASCTGESQDGLCDNDAADHCSGTDTTCVDAYFGAETICRAAVDLCDMAETCDGISSDCPADILEPAGTECRASAGDCDMAETCDGINPDCPADVLEPAGTECRESAGDCDIAETCDGSSAVCPADDFVEAGTECRASTGECDIAESCTGSDADCPEDMFQPEGTACGDDSDSICDNPDSCDATGQCQANNEPTTTLCRADAGECDVAEYCDGAGYCPDDGFEEPGTPCGDQTAGLCTGPGMCNDEGICLSGNHSCAMVTSSSLCPFDMEPTKGECVVDHGDWLEFTGACECSSGTYDDGVCLVDDAPLSCGSGGICKQSNDFRLLFSPDVQAYPAYKLNASNPGQFYFNLIVDTDTVDISIPYPFVTQGSQPVHVYGGDVPIANGCFLPEEGTPLNGPIITLADYQTSCGPDDQLSTVPYTFTLTGLSDYFVDGLAYVNIHLDYGLKGPHVDANPCDEVADRYDRGAYISPWNSSDALQNTDGNDGPVAIVDLQNYFFFGDAGNYGDDFYEMDFIQNVNPFKNIAGAFGRITCGDPGDGSAVAADLELWLVGGSVPVASASTDEDGYYALVYKHKGKAAQYYIKLTFEDDSSFESDYFWLQANGWVEADLTSDSCAPDYSWNSLQPVYGSGKYAK